MKSLFILFIMVGLLFMPDMTHELSASTSYNSRNGISYDMLKPYLESGIIAFNPITIKSQNSLQLEPHKTLPVYSLKNDNWATESKVARALNRAGGNAKLGFVLDEAKKAKVPAVVAAVPIIESNYNKDAVSSKGAGGAWQLMPGTASEYGLDDEDRFDFESSTKVAIAILHDLHEQFGNWALTFAAYNCGSGCVSNALKQNPNANDLDELNLPSETKQYVSKIAKLSQRIAKLGNIDEDASCSILGMYCMDID